MRTISVKILGHKASLRYPVERVVIAAQRELPNVDLAIEMVKTASEIQKYTHVLALPSLVVNERLVCVGRFPSKDEALFWLKEAQEKRE